MNKYRIVESNIMTLSNTGKVDHFLADSMEEAVKNVVYFQKLQTKHVYIGPTGKVVYTPMHCYSVFEVK